MSYTAADPVRVTHNVGTFELANWLSPNYSGAWPSANLAIYVPILVQRRVVVKTLWYASNTTGTGNIDIGLFDASGVKLVSSGATAKSTSQAEHVLDITDTTVGPGLYYIGLSCSNATDTFYRAVPSAPTALALGVYSEASAHPLPATATFAANQTLAYIPIVGAFLTTVVT